VLDDGLLLTLDRARFEKVTEPKVLGAWNLHGLLRERRLDFFVMFSSAGAMLGSAGQGNHVAGNAFLDALAHYRRGRGLPALSIGWSQWGEVGEAAKAERGGRLEAQGVPSLTTEQGLRALSLLLRQESPRVGVMKFDLRRWSKFYPRAANSPLLREVAGGRGVAAEREDERGGVRASLAAAASDRLRRELLEEFLRGEVAWVLRVSAKEIVGDTLFSDLGLDSLGSLELRNRLEHALDLKLPATLVWQFPTVEVLAPHLAEKLGTGAGGADEGAAPAASERDARRRSLVAGIERLSEEEAGALLHSRLESLQETSPDQFTD
jgi:myxalamid-type polyketide synthase MxaD